MYVKTVCKQYGINQNEFEEFLLRFGDDIDYSYTSVGYDITDSYVPMIVARYLDAKDGTNTEATARQEFDVSIEGKRVKEEKHKQEALTEMLITSGFTFDGYKITKYSGYISGDDCVTIPANNIWGSNIVDKNLCDALVKIRRQAMKELKEAAYELGCNAVIGVDFDYLVMDPQDSMRLSTQTYVICVTANGNAVVIEKE